MQEIIANIVLIILLIISAWIFFKIGNKKEKKELKKELKLEFQEKEPKLIRCKTCGQEVSKTAFMCPHCGEKLPGLDIKCPRCGSMNIRIGQKGFSPGRAAVGGIFLGIWGLLAGMIDREKSEFVCQACGHKWEPDPKDLG